jgi:hypothetical protein
LRAEHHPKNLSPLISVTRSNGRGSNELYLMVFKPNRLLNICSFQSDQVETKRLIKISRNTIDLEDRSPKPPKGTITGHTHSTAYFKEVASFFLPLTELLIYC